MNRKKKRQVVNLRDHVSMMEAWKQLHTVEVKDDRGEEGQESFSNSGIGESGAEGSSEVDKNSESV
jgi:hypothetical protein